MHFASHLVVGGTLFTALVIGEEKKENTM